MWSVYSQSLDAGDDGVEGGLDVSGRAGAHHGQVVVLQHVRQVLGHTQTHTSELDLRYSIH